MAQKYSRAFITLMQDRAGYGRKGREPSGRAIIEVKNGHGKISVSVQDLKQEIIYKAYIVSSENGGRAVCIGSLSTDERGKCELKWEFDPMNVEHTGIAIGAFDIVSIAVRSKTETVWVLTGYRNGEVRFKDIFNEKTEFVRGHQGIGEAVTKPAPEAQELLVESASDTKEILTEDISGVLTEDAAEIPAEKVTEVTAGEIAEVTAEEASETEEIAGVTTEEVSETEEVPAELAIDAEEVLAEAAYEIPNEPVTVKEETLDTAEFIAMDTEEPVPEVDIHENFRKMARRFNDELRELESLMYKETEQKTELERVMENNASMSPFKDSKLKEASWVRISLRELALLPGGCWKLINDPFITLAYTKYRHMMLGRRPDKVYLLALPEAFTPEGEVCARKLGFKSFESCDNILQKYKNENYGYWMLEVDG